MREVQASEAKIHLSQLLDEVERGEIIRIAHHGRTIALLVPEAHCREAEIGKAIDSIMAARLRTGRITREELLSARRGDANSNAVRARPVCHGGQQFMDRNPSLISNEERHGTHSALGRRLPVQRDPLSHRGRARMADGLPLQRMQAAVRRGLWYEPQDARGRRRAHQRRGETLDPPLRQCQSGHLPFLRDLRNTPLARACRIGLLAHQTRNAGRSIATGAAFRGLDEAQGALAGDRRAEGQLHWTTAVGLAADRDLRHCQMGCHCSARSLAEATPSCG